MEKLMCLIYFVGFAFLGCKDRATSTQTKDVQINKETGVVTSQLNDDIVFEMFFERLNPDCKWNSGSITGQMSVDHRDEQSLRAMLGSKGNIFVFLSNRRQSERKVQTKTGGERTWYTLWILKNDEKLSETVVQKEVRSAPVLYVPENPTNIQFLNSLEPRSGTSILSYKYSTTKKVTTKASSCFGSFLAVEGEGPVDVAGLEEMTVKRKSGEIESYKFFL
ncbi:MAG: hypothetical protein NTV34_13635 [Proteobacteria bacterium]|nr:hypothetical protein [Pseudomonadota bacterium]